MYICNSLGRMCASQIWWHFIVGDAMVIKDFEVHLFLGFIVVRKFAPRNGWFGA
jgi:hypothetical protein